MSAKPLRGAVTWGTYSITPPAGGPPASAVGESLPWSAVVPPRPARDRFGPDRNLRVGSPPPSDGGAEPKAGEDLHRSAVPASSALPCLLLVPFTLPQRRSATPCGAAQT